ncbi:MAG: 2-C-methyl-D-erythritol 2,4-cyclodiphosphate synthase [Deltaproteobacteria bacterium]|nr:MAG: 2-C-methyl-D-erythritol 2,4-cyclodiphosphate synthase [Deltaproteobacteria bacterium]
MRIGIGYDVHRLAKDRKLVLGGVTIPFEKGLLGHSDADVLIHAVCDALLGAAGCGDIGRHFPDTDPTLKGVSSIKLLKNTYQIINTKSRAVINVDATIIAEAPRLQPYLESMKQNIAETLGIDPEQINVKATTTEGLGIIGKGEGMAALCVALID